MDEEMNEELQPLRDAINSLHDITAMAVQSARLHPRAKEQLRAIQMQANGAKHKLRRFLRSLSDTDQFKTLGRSEETL